MTHKMTRLTAFCLVFVILLATAACDFAEHPTETVPNPTTEPNVDILPTTLPTVPNIAQIESNVSTEQVRMSGFHENWVTAFQTVLGDFVKVTSVEELNAVAGEIRSLDKTFAFTGTYDESFFVDSYIVVVPLQSTSGSVRYQVQAKSDLSGITMEIAGGINGMGTDDMADWLLVVVLPRGEYPVDTSITVKVGQVKYYDPNLDINDR